LNSNGSSSWKPPLRYETDRPEPLRALIRGRLLLTSGRPSRRRLKHEAGIKPRTVHPKLEEKGRETVDLVYKVDDENFNVVFAERRVALYVRNSMTRCAPIPGPSLGPRFPRAVGKNSSKSSGTTTTQWTISLRVASLSMAITCRPAIPSGWQTPKFGGSRGSHQEVWRER